MATMLQRGYVTRITAEGTFVELPRNAPGFEYGPMDSCVLYLRTGDHVLVGSVDNLSDELVIIGKLQRARNAIGRVLETETARPITPVLM